MRSSIVTAISALACLVSGNQFKNLGRLLPPLEDADVLAADVAAAPVNTTGSGFFTQLLDHDNPSKGTFQQKFWWNSEFWAGPGSPVSTQHVSVHNESEPNRSGSGCLFYSR